MPPNVVSLFEQSTPQSGEFLWRVVKRPGIQQVLRDLLGAAQASSSVGEIDPESMDETKLMLLSIVVEDLAREWHHLSARFAGAERRRGVNDEERALLRARLQSL